MAGKRQYVGCFFLLVSVAVDLARATDGNELIGVGAIQKGTAGAGVAAPQDSTWALLNPASIIALEKRLDVSLEYLDLFRAATPDGFPLLVNNTAFHVTDHSAIFVPSIGMIVPLETGTLGFGMFGVQGNKAQYDRSRTTFPFSRGNDRRSELQIAKFPISYAYQFDNGWTIGASILPVATVFRTDSLTLRLRPTEGDFKLDLGLGIGMQLGFYKEWDRFSIGGTWTSRQFVQQYKDYEDLIKWNLDVPEKIQVGFDWKVTDRLQLIADYKYQHWSAIKQFGEPTIKGGLGWQDQDIYKIGLIYELNDDWTLRAGYSFGNAPVDASHAFANALSPAIAKEHFTLGFSHRLTEHSDIHFAWTHTFPEELTDDGKGDIFSKLGRGTSEEYKEDAYTIQYTYRF